MKKRNLHTDMKNMRRILVGFSIAILAAGCSSSRKVSSSEAGELASLYNPSEYSLNVDYRLFHITDDLTSLYIRIFPGELLFNQANEDAEYRALVSIQYHIFELDEDEEIVAVTDSSGFQVKLNRWDEDRTAYFTSKVLSVESGKRYMIRLESRDMQRGTLGLKYLYIDKMNPFSSQNFSVVSARTGYPRFQNYMASDDVFRIKYRFPGIDTIYLDLFRDNYRTPRPPITLESPSSHPLVIDTTFIIAFSDTLNFTLPERGMYHFRVDSMRREGITLHNFGPDYPRVNTPRGMLEPLFYIATMTEYNQLLERENTKRAVDDFWLARATSMERSRELIRVYYNRVLYSNLYFGADREGWRTDRGMIFILMGPPDRMKDTGFEERWYYGSRRQGRVIEFVFRRKPSVYSNQNLVWTKNIESMQHWSAAISSWRSGKVYSLGK